MATFFSWNAIFTSSISGLSLSAEKKKLSFKT